MIRAQIYITREERAALNAIAKKTAKTHSELIRETIDSFVEYYRQPLDKKLGMQQAKGLWKDRKDLPDFKKLRKEFNFFD